MRSCKPPRPGARRSRSADTRLRLIARRVWELRAGLPRGHSASSFTSSSRIEPERLARMSSPRTCAALRRQLHEARAAQTWTSKSERGGSNVLCTIPTCLPQAGLLTVRRDRAHPYPRKGTRRLRARRADEHPSRRMTLSSLLETYAGYERRALLLYLRLSDASLRPFASRLWRAMSDARPVTSPRCLAPIALRSRSAPLPRSSSTSRPIDTRLTRSAGVAATRQRGAGG